MGGLTAIEDRRGAVASVSGAVFLPLSAVTPQALERACGEDPGFFCRVVFEWTEDRELAVLQSDEVAFRAQVIGLVVAETSELARQAADSIGVTYSEQPHDSALSVDRPDLYAP